MVPVLTFLWVGLVTVLWVGIVAGVWALVSVREEYPPDDQPDVSQASPDD